MDKVKNLVVTLNKQALKLIKEASPHSAIRRLDQALQVLQMNFAPEYSELYWMTYSNYGLILKKHNKLEQALNCFLIASEYCPEHSIQLAECVLRACNLLSRLNNHQRALDLALKALKVLSQSDHHIKIIAFQNAGAEYEYLNMKSDAVKMYKCGYAFVKRLLGRFNSVALMFKKRYMEIESFSESVKQESSINIITNKPLKYEFVSKTPDLKNNRSKKKIANEPQSLKLLKNRIKMKDRMQSLSPHLKTSHFRVRIPDHSFLNTLNCKKTKKNILDELYMVDSLQPSAKIHNSSLTNPKFPQKPQINVA